MEKYYINISNEKEFDIWIKQLKILWYKLYNNSLETLLKMCNESWIITWDNDWYIKSTSWHSLEFLSRQWHKKIPLLKVWTKIKFIKWSSIYTITKIDWNNITMKTLNKIYINWINKIINNIELIDDSIKQKELEWLPKYFIIEKDIDNPLWIKYIEWINKKYNLCLKWDWKWYYWYDWSTESWIDFWDNVSKFENNPTLITLEQWYNIVSKSEEIKYKSIIEYSISWIDVWSITTDYHWNIIEPILNNNKYTIIDKLNDIRSKKFFDTEKNLNAIEKLDETLNEWIDLIQDSIIQLSDAKTKLESLQLQAERSIDNSDIKVLKELISSTKIIEEFISELKDKTISKFERAKDKLDIKWFLNK